MRIDELKRPDNIYFVNSKWDKVDYDINDDFTYENMVRQNSSIKYQIVKYLEVRESVCRVTNEKDKWPVRFLKWLVERLPNSWKAGSAEVYCGGSTIGTMFPVIKYLVEKRGWSLDDSAILVSELCSRCSNVLDDEVLKTPATYNYNHFPDTWCKHCHTIDPKYNNKYILWKLLKVYRDGGSVSEVYREFK